MREPLHSSRRRPGGRNATVLTPALRSSRGCLIIVLALLCTAAGCQHEIPPPTIILVTPAEGETLEEDGALTFTVEAVEGRLELVEVRVNENEVRFPAVELRTFGRFSVPLPILELGPGEHRITITARAVDGEAEAEARAERRFGIVLPPTTMTGVELLPARVEQGQPFAIDVHFDGPAAEVTATLFDRSFPLYRVESGMGDGGRGERWRALAGCRLLSAPGGNNLVIEFRGDRGEHGRESIALEVVRGDFDTAYIQIPAHVVSRLDPVISEREAAHTREVVSRYSPEQLWDAGGFIRPVPGRVTSPFGQRRTYSTGGQSSHIGVDLRAAEGEPVVAMARGRVVIAEEQLVRGGYVCLDHGRGLFSLYNHFSRIDVEVGQLVEAGQQIGLAGSTGVATGPHLHFEVRLTTWAVDPLAIIANPPTFE